MTPRPPGPAGHPWLGNGPTYERDRLGFLLRCAREFGGVVRFSETTSIINDADLIGEVLSQTDGPFQMGANFFSTPRTADEIQTLREKVAPAFAPSMIESKAANVVSVVDNIADHWKQDESVDITEAMRLITSKVMSRFCFGDDSEKIRLCVGRLMSALPRGGGNAVALSSPQAALFRLSPYARIRRRIAERRFHTEAKRLIQAVRKDDRAEQSLVSVLLANDDGLDDDDRVERLALVVALAGYSVPALPLAWLYFILARRPACRARLRTEIADVVGDRDPVPADVDNLPYTQALIREVLRLYPPTWLLTRYVAQDVTLGGYPLSPGHAVVFSPYVTGRDGRYFEEPDAFIPERWMTAEQSTRPRYAYFPFGAGSHACVGARFATIEMALVLASLEPKIEFVVPDEARVRPSAHHGLAPKGLIAQIHKRQVRSLSDPAKERQQVRAFRSRQR